MLKQLIDKSIITPGSRNYSKEQIKNVGDYTSKFDKAAIKEGLRKDLYKKDSEIINWINTDARKENEYSIVHTPENVAMVNKLEKILEINGALNDYSDLLKKLANTNKKNIAIFQILLNKLGYKDHYGNDVQVDGLFGPSTFFALTVFQSDSENYNKKGRVDFVINGLTLAAMQNDIQSIYPVKEIEMPKVQGTQDVSKIDPQTKIDMLEKIVPSPQKVFGSQEKKDEASIPQTLPPTQTKDDKDTVQKPLEETPGTTDLQPVPTIPHANEVRGTIVRQEIPQQATNQESLLPHEPKQLEITPHNLGELVNELLSTKMNDLLPGYRETLEINLIKKGAVYNQLWEFLLNDCDKRTKIESLNNSGYSKFLRDFNRDIQYTPDFRKKVELLQQTHIANVFNIMSLINTQPVNYLLLGKYTSELELNFNQTKQVLLDGIKAGIPEKYALITFRSFSKTYDEYISKLEKGDELALYEMSSDVFKNNDMLDSKVFSQFDIIDLPIKEYTDIVNSGKDLNKIDDILKGKQIKLFGKKFDIKSSNYSKDLENILDSFDKQIDQNSKIKIVTLFLMTKIIQENADQIKLSLNPQELKLFELFLDKNSQFNNIKNNWRIISLKLEIMLATILVSGLGVGALLARLGVSTTSIGGAVGTILTQTAVLTPVVEGVGGLLDNKDSDKIIGNMTNPTNYGKFLVYSTLFRAVLGPLNTAIGRGLDGVKLIGNKYALTGFELTLGATAFSGINSVMFNGEFTPQEMLNSLIYMVFFKMVTPGVTKSQDGNIRIVERGVVLKSDGTKVGQKSAEKGELLIDMKQVKDGSGKKVYEVDPNNGKTQNVILGLPKGDSTKSYTFENILDGSKSKLGDSLRQVNQRLGDKMGELNDLYSKLKGFESQANGARKDLLEQNSRIDTLKDQIRLLDSKLMATNDPKLVKELSDKITRFKDNLKQSELDMNRKIQDIRQYDLKANILSERMNQQLNNTIPGFSIVRGLEVTKQFDLVGKPSHIQEFILSNNLQPTMMLRFYSTRIFVMNNPTADKSHIVLGIPNANGEFVITKININDLPNLSKLING